MNNAIRLVFRSGLLIGFAIALPGLPTIAQTAKAKEPQPPAPGLRSLAGDEAQRAAAPEQAIAAAQQADRWDEAIARTEELLVLRRRVQGPKHFETVDAEGRLDALRQVARRSKDDRIGYQSALTLDEQAGALFAQGKYAQAQPLWEKALETCRRLLGDDHPVTANTFKDVVWNLKIQRTWNLNAELVTLSAGETALGRQAGGDGYVGFTQALLLSGARSVCLSLWKVDDTATVLLMPRFYANLLGRRPGLTAPMPKPEALREAKAWLRGLRRAAVLAAIAELSGAAAPLEPAQSRPPDALATMVPAGGENDRPYASPHFWAAFVLVGDPD